ncbi:YciI family protein [Promicromonospora kroppenstedtii]|uniref:YciI family protein n=1 Tax=Promicromonospora kroppenstedtii TaxID=440482 RepID=A0ABW7XK81_9MICO
MRYLMLTIEPDVPDRGPTPDLDRWVAERDASGIRVTGSRLRPAADTRRVAVRDGRTIVTDGPFTESKEIVGGFDIIEAPDLDAALTIAAAYPGARDGLVEVHPYWPTDDEPPGA